MKIHTYMGEKPITETTQYTYEFGRFHLTFIVKTFHNRNDGKCGEHCLRNIVNLIMLLRYT